MVQSWGMDRHQMDDFNHANRYPVSFGKTGWGDRFDRENREKAKPQRKPHSVIMDFKVGN